MSKTNYVSNCQSALYLLPNICKPYSRLVKYHNV